MDKAEEKNKYIFALLIFVVVVIGVAAAILIFNNSPAHKLKKQLSLGERYLEELKYNEALLAFNKAIEIEPRSEAAYVGIANVYLAQDNFVSALEIIKRGIAIIGETEVLLMLKSKIEDRLKTDEKEYVAEDTIREEERKSNEPDVDEKITEQLTPFIELEGLLIDYSDETSNSSGGGFYGYGRTYSDRENAYAPLINMLEEYIGSLSENPIDILMEKPEWQDWFEGMSARSESTYVIIGENKFPKMAYAYFILQKCYRDSGQLDKVLNTRKNMIQWFENCDDSILSEHSDNRGFVYDEYGRTIMTEDGGSHYSYRYSDKVDVITEIYEDEVGWYIEYFFDNGRIEKIVQNYDTLTLTENYTYSGDGSTVHWVSNGGGETYEKDYRVDKFGFLHSS